MLGPGPGAWVAFRNIEKCDFGIHTSEGRFGINTKVVRPWFISSEPITSARQGSSPWGASAAQRRQGPPNTLRAGSMQEQRNRPGKPRMPPHLSRGPMHTRVGWSCSCLAQTCGRQTLFRKWFKGCICSWLGRRALTHPPTRMMQKIGSDGRTDADRCRGQLETVGRPADGGGC